MARKCTPVEIEQMTRHLRAVVESVVKREGLAITFEDLTVAVDESDELPPMIVITFNQPPRMSPEVFVKHSESDDEIQF